MTLVEELVQVANVALRIAEERATVYPADFMDMMVNERMDSIDKFGKQEYLTLAEWVVVLTEEVGEVAKIVCDLVHEKAP